MQIALNKHDALSLVYKFGAVQFAGFEFWLTIERRGYFTRTIRMAPLGKRHLWECYEHLSTRGKLRYAQERGAQAAQQARHAIQAARAALVA